VWGRIDNCVIISAIFVCSVSRRACHKTVNNSVHLKRNRRPEGDRPRNASERHLNIQMPQRVDGLFLQYPVRKGVMGSAGVYCTLAYCAYEKYLKPQILAEGVHSSDRDMKVILKQLFNKILHYLK